MLGLLVWFPLVVVDSGVNSFRLDLQLTEKATWQTEYETRHPAVPPSEGNCRESKDPQDMKVIGRYEL